LPTLENQWDQGLGLQGFESPKLERSEEKEGEELLERQGGTPSVKVGGAWSVEVKRALYSMKKSPTRN